jgi:uncharacterized protein (UPF0332 family)
MFDWKIYLLLSEKLLDMEDAFSNLDPSENKDSQNSDNDLKEALHRTICSRSYYSIFKEIEDFFKERNIPYNPKRSYKGSHDKLITFLEEESQELGKRLRELRGLREKADYRCHPPVIKRSAERAIKLAHQAFNEFKKSKEQFLKRSRNGNYPPYRRKKR